MSLSARQIAQVLTEIGPALTGGAIHKIDQPQPWSLIFEIHRGRERYHLFLSGHRHFSRLHLSEKNHPNPSSPPRFCQLLRARLRWKRIVALRQRGDDRIVEMICGWTEEGAASADAGAVSLIAELMGAASNFFLVDPQGILLGALLPPSPGRGLEAGRPYRPPPLHPAGPFKEIDIQPLDAAPFSFNRSVEARLAPMEAAEAAEEEKKRLLAVIDAGLRRCQKRLRQLSAGLLEAERADEYRYEGELLKGQLHHVRTGMTEIPLFDPAHPERLRILSLDPALSPSENLARIFKRYKKAQGAQAHLREQVEKTEEEIETLERSRRTLLEGGTIALERGDRAAPRTKKEKKGESGPPQFLSADGWTLIVGRNARENEEITFRIARGNDLWFHARGLPGSHLIVRMERRTEIPYQTLLDAATLALHFSDGRKAGKGDVVYTHRKYIQRPRGGKPGAVVVSQEKNIYIEIDPKRLERLFKEKISPSSPG